MKPDHHQLYQCPECGLHYQDEATMKRCQAWCSTHSSCNLEVAKNSVEARQSTTTPTPKPPKI